ncbi:N-acetyltransferase family protein [Enterococcus olivae]
MKIEKATRENLPQIVALHQKLVPFELTLEDAEAIYQKMIHDTAYYLAVAKEGDQVLGTALGICCQTLAAPFLVIEDVIVEERLRGNGIGKNLMHSLDVFAEEKQCQYALLVSSGHRKAAHHFYQRMGFTEDVLGFRKVYDTTV